MFAFTHVKEVLYFGHEALEEFANATSAGTGNAKGLSSLCQSCGEIVYDYPSQRAQSDGPARA